MLLLQFGLPLAVVPAAVRSTNDPVERDIGGLMGNDQRLQCR